MGRAAASRGRTYNVFMNGAAAGSSTAFLAAVLSAGLIGSAAAATGDPPPPADGHCATLAPESPPAGPAPAEITEPAAVTARERDDLLAGGVRVGEFTREGRRVRTRVSVWVNAPVQRIWDVIISCRQARRFVAGLRECAVLEETGACALTRQVVDKGWATPRLDYTFVTRRTPWRRMTFVQVEGNLRFLSGAWTFAPLGSGWLVTHELELEPRFAAPGWLVRRNLQRDLPDMLRCIRALADGSPNDLQAVTDRAACVPDPPAVGR